MKQILSIGLCSCLVFLASLACATTKAKVNWDRNEFEITGEVSYPAVPDTNEDYRGTAGVQISGVQVLETSKYYDFILAGRNHDKWEYKDRHPEPGCLKEYKVEWKPAEFDWKDKDNYGSLHLHTHSIGNGQTTFCVHSEEANWPITVTIDDATIEYSASGDITTLLAYDAQKGKETHVHFELPFELDANTEIVVDLLDSAASPEITASDCYKEARLKFKIKGIFQGITPDVSPAIVAYDVTFNETSVAVVFDASDTIGDDEDWDKFDERKWEYKSKKAIFMPPNTVAQPTYHKFNLSTFDENLGIDVPLACVSVFTEFGALAITDDNGVATLYEPGLMGENLNITFKRDGYLGQTTRYNVSESGNTAVSLELDPDRPLSECAATGVFRDRVSAATVSTASERFLVRVFDPATDRGVPLVELQSPHSTYVSDSNGLISLDPKSDPALFSETVFFTVFGHGYQLVDPQGLGGVYLSPSADGYAEIEVEQRSDQVAHRIYRITGAGIYRDSVLADISTPLVNPTLQARISGTDWAHSTIYRDNVYRITADTLSIDGAQNFRVTGGYSPLPESGGMDPDLGVEPTYILDDNKGFTKKLAHEPTMPNPEGYKNLLVWTDGLWTVPESGEQMYASYRMIAPLYTVAERGIMHFRHVWSDFEKSLVFTDEHLIQPYGHSYYWWHDGSEYIYYYNTVRIPRNAASVLDPSTYQAFTALQQDSTSVLARDDQGNLIYSWKTNTPLITQEMIDAGLDVASYESILGHFRDPDSGFEPQIHENGSTAWNHYRNRFVRILSEVWSSTSLIGENWIAEGDTPFGPWVYAKKIVTHDDYSFYNPRHHYFLDQEGGREIFFEATYANFYTSSEKTPGYDYNQIMYKLELDDERIILPVAIYNLAANNTESYLTSKTGIRAWMEDPPVVFMALDRSVTGTVPVHQTGADCGSQKLTVNGGYDDEPVFYALPADSTSLPVTAIPLYEYEDAQNNEYFYDPDANLSLPGYTRSESPIVYVWENPMSITLPVTDYLADHIADAGADICTTEDSYQSGAVTINLDASASSHAGATIDNYTWSWSGGSASGDKPQITLDVGTHVISLTTTASDGSTSSDSVIVEVSERAPTPNTAPTVTTSDTQTNTENDSIEL